MSLITSNAAIPLGMKPQWSDEFLDGMIRRMSMSAFKYGDVRDAYPEKIDAIASCFVRLIRYLGADEFKRQAHDALIKMEAVETADHRRENGNTEYLIDAANFCMIEFMLPRNPNAHYTAEDSSQSPGRVHSTGALNDASNTASADNVRLGGSSGQTSGGYYKREGD